jgi:platelet-activating factor acetylhydrolase
LSVLKSINNGDGDSVRRASSRGEGATLSGWKGVLDFDHLIMSGHSFGTNAAV